MTDRWIIRFTAFLVGLAAGCTAVSEPPPGTASVATSATSASSSTATSPVPPGTVTDPERPASTSPASVPRTTAATSAFARPPWLGTRPLPLRTDGYGRAAATPPDLRDRRFASVDHLPPPESDAFEWSIGSVTPAIEARSTWHDGCPVPAEDLRYLTVSFLGFDGLPHTGELLVHSDVARDLIDVFRTLYESRFPIEDMQIADSSSLTAPPTGDGNNTTAFVCRRITGGSSTWSEHAFGRAVDLNPFHNPYRKGDLVLPELASAYLDRERVMAGMITSDGVVVEAFTAIGWGWGGAWATIEDYHHFSALGR